MQQRSISIAASTMLSAMAGIYCFMAGAALLIGGNVANRAGSEMGNLVIGLGAVFLVVSLAAYVVGTGLWLRRTWAWAGAAVLFAAVLVANVFLSVMAGNFINLVLPVAGTAVAVALLSRPATKAAFFPARTAAAATVATPNPEVAQVAG
jgi:hypothetical protein